MSTNRDIQRIDDILSEISAIRKSTSSLVLETFLASDDKKSALSYHLIVIGEAANSISEETQVKYPFVKWHEIIGLRNILAHHYRKTHYGELWNVVVNDLDVLEKQMRDIKASYPWPIE